VKLPKWLQPIKDQTLRAARHVLQRPPREPTLEEFQSPLREQCKDYLATKEAIGYNTTCACCSRQHGFDEKIAAAIDTLEDPQPWLAQLHGDLVSTRRELQETRVTLAEARRDADRWKNPLNRIRWVAVGTFASSSVVLGFKAVEYLLPWLLALIP
jgi:hypothetical protein